MQAKPSRRDQRYAVSVDGATVHYEADTLGRVSWMDKWEVCDELARRGIFHSVNHGPATYGHMTYYALQGMPV